MKIYDYKLIKPFSWCLVLCMTLFVNMVSAQEELPCDDQVQISVGADCSFAAAADVFTEGDLAASGVVVTEISFSTIPPTTVAEGDDVTLECGTYTFTVTEASGNSCWGTVVVEDKLPPTSVSNPCPPDTPCPENCLTVDGRADNDKSILIGGAVGLNTVIPDDGMGVEDCSGPVEVIRPEKPVVVPGENCEDSIMYYYIYSFVDAKGNVGSDTLAYRVGALSLDSLTMPDTYIGTCNETDLDPNTLESNQPGGGLISYTGVDPTDFTSVLDFGPDQTATACNLIITYWDIKELPTCEGEGCGLSRKVLREWTVVDWCGGGTIDSIQLLDLKDTIAPVITPTEDKNYSVDPWSCSVENLHVDIDATDNCAEESALHYSLFGPLGVAITGGDNGVFTIASAPKGMHQFIAYAEDCCDNISEPDTFYINIKDEIKPTAIAKEFTVASVVQVQNVKEDGQKAIAKVFAQSIDNGSYDMCTDVYLEVRRLNEDNEVMLDVCDEDDDGNTTEEDAWGPFVKFCCADIGEESHKVELRVWDDANMSGVYGDTIDGCLDNYNVTWGYVKVEDPNPPKLEVEDCDLYCHEVEVAEIHEIINGSDWDDLYDYLEENGGCVGTAKDVCHNDLPAEIVDADWDYINKECNIGKFYVKWRAVGSKGSYVEDVQHVKIYYKGDFSCEDVHWPDYVGVVKVDDCMPEGSPDLTFDAGACELIGWNKDSTIFEFETNACMKIVYDYTVVDWCIYDAYKADDQDFYDLWKSDVTIKKIPKDAHESEYSCIPDLDTDKHGHSTYDRDDLDDRPHENGKYTWTYTVKVFSEEAPDLIITSPDEFSASADCNTPVHVTAEADADCEAMNLRWELNAEVVSGDSLGNTYTYKDRGEIVYHFEDILFPVGTCIEGTIKVWDGCGNSKVEHFDFCVVDEKAPTPYCINLSSAFMQPTDHDNDPSTDDVSMVELWAIDFDENSFDCYETLFFTFDEISMHVPSITEDHFYAVDGEGVVQLLAKAGDANYEEVRTSYLGGDLSEFGTEIYWWDASERSSGQVFTCAKNGVGVTELKVTVWDPDLNYDFCTVDLRLEGDNDCGGGGSNAMIAGGIANEAGSSVAGVQVNLDGLTNPEYKLTTTTADAGTYAFDNNPMYNAYDISASKGGIHKEGVTTRDLVMIQRHILGLSEFESPYKVIASDINNNGDVSATDLIVLRKLILGIYDEFPSNESWRFVEADQALSVENALIDFNEVINIADLSNSRMNEDFVAVKIGDVDGDASTNARENGISTRTDNRVTLTIADRNVKAGEKVDITFSTADFNEVYGYQFTLGLNGLKFEGVSAGSANVTADNIAQIDDNTLTVSYSDVAGLSASDNVFTISATATNDGSIGDMININSSKLTSQAYTGTSLDISTVELTVEGQTDLGFELGQNEPNPFNDFTVVGFTLPQDAQATITVFDVAGKVVTLKREFYNKGYNTVKFTKNELGASGVLYYTLESGEYTATKKMIIIE